MLIGAFALSSGVVSTQRGNGNSNGGGPGGGDPEPTIHQKIANLQLRIGFLENVASLGAFPAQEWPPN